MVTVSPKLASPQPKTPKISVTVSVMIECSYEMLIPVYTQRWSPGLCRLSTERAGLGRRLLHPGGLLLALVLRRHVLAV